MRGRPPRFTRTDTLVPYTTLFRSELGFLLQQESQDDQTVAQGAGDDRSGQPAELIGNHVVPSDAALLAIVFGIGAGMYGARRSDEPHSVRPGHLSGRSDERRAGQECVSTCRSGWSQ